MSAKRRLTQQNACARLTLRIVNALLMQTLVRLVLGGTVYMYMYHHVLFDWPQAHEASAFLEIFMQRPNSSLGS